MLTKKGREESKREQERVTQRESMRERERGERERAIERPRESKSEREWDREQETQRGRERQKEEREREGGRERGWEEEGEYARMCVRQPWTSGSSFYVFSSPWACPLWIGLARAAVCSTWGPHSGSWTFLCSVFMSFSRPCLLATSILDSFFLFYLTHENQCIPNQGKKDFQPSLRTRPSPVLIHYTSCVRKPLTRDFKKWNRRRFI